MTEADIHAILYATLFLALGASLAALGFQGFLIGHQRHGYSRRDSRRDHAIMRERLEHLLQLGVNKRY